MVKEIKIAAYDYPLPKERIAPHPEGERDACRLLVSEADGSLHHYRFSDLPSLIPAGSLMVRNNTRVINARLKFHKLTGAEIEIFLLEPFEPADYARMFQAEGRCSWSCLVGNSKKWKEGELVKDIVTASGIEVRLSASRLASAPDGSQRVEFVWMPASVPWQEVVEAAGFIPIPPYLCRDSEESDATDYQTVYSRIEGSVAAPTAGLHFTDSVIAALEEKDVEIADVTLHIGAGTFRPVKCDAIGDHPMHTEVFTVTEELVRNLVDALESGREVIAVGTTSVRTIESLPYLGSRIMAGDDLHHVEQWDPYGSLGEELDTTAALRAILAEMKRRKEKMLTASTAIMIAPGYKWRITNALITNFHQPRSTLLLLVSAFLEPGKSDAEASQWKKIYDEALGSGYRFLSYGDSSLLYPCAR